MRIDVAKAVNQQIEGKNINESMTTIRNVKPKKEEKVLTRPEKKEYVEPVEEIRESTVVHNPIFDINNPDVIFPKRNKLNAKVPTARLSLYLLEDERELLEKCAEKHHMTAGQYIRTLIINSQ